MEFIETSQKCPNDTLFVKKLSLEVWECIMVMFKLPMILAISPPNGSLYVVAILIQNFAFCIEISWNFTRITVPLVSQG